MYELRTHSKCPDREKPLCQAWTEPRDGESYYRNARPVIYGPDVDVTCRRCAERLGVPYVADRTSEALRLRRHGFLLREVGEALGVSRERARQLIGRAAEAERRGL